MRIAHLGPAEVPVLHRKGGAIQRRIRDLSAAQRSLGHDVIIYSADNNTDTISHKGVEVRNVRCNLRGPLRTLEFLAKIPWRALRHVDVLHFHSIPEGALLCRNYRAITLLSFDHFEFRRGNKTPLYVLYRQALKKFTRLLPVSQFCLDNSAAYWRLDPSRMTVLFNGVDLDHFRPDSSGCAKVRQDMALQDGPLALYVGRVCEQKGSDVLVEAFRVAKQTLPALQLLVVGPPGQFGRTEKNPLIDQFEQSGARHVPAVDEDLLPILYNLADIFIMPSRKEEMFGMAALEAQACGKPVICSKQGGLPEVVAPESGVLVPAGDSAALANAMVRTLTDRELRIRLAGFARPNSERFSWDRIARDVDELVGLATASEKPRPKASAVII